MAEANPPMPAPMMFIVLMDFKPYFGNRIKQSAMRFVYFKHEE